MNLRNIAPEQLEDKSRALLSSRRWCSTSPAVLFNFGNRP